jgi:hypothetical protein
MAADLTDEQMFGGRTHVPQLLTDEEMGFGGAPAPPEMSAAESAARGALAGVTADWDDEAAGALNWAKQRLQRNFSDDTYQTARDEARATKKRAQAANPKAYLAGELGGGLALGAATAPLGAVGGGALLGGAAAAGASESEDPMNVVAQAGQGAALGGLAGAAAKGLGSLVRKGAQGAGKAAAQAGDQIAAQNLGGGGAISGQIAKLAGRPGSLVERAGRLGLMDSVAWADREAAAKVASEEASGGIGKVFQRLDTHPEVAAPDARTFVSGLQTAPGMAAHLNHPILGGQLSGQAQQMMLPVAFAKGWAAKFGEVSLLEEKVAPLLQKAASGGQLTAMERAKVDTFKAIRGIFMRSADDAARAAGQPTLGAQVESLEKDRALAGLVQKAAATKADNEGLAGSLFKRAGRIGGMISLLHGNVPGAIAGFAGPALEKAVAKRAAPLAAKAAASLGASLSKESTGLARQVARGAPGVAAQFLGKQAAKKDDLSVAGAHMVAQQVSESYRKKTGDKENEQ